MQAVYFKFVYYQILFEAYLSYTPIMAVLKKTRKH